MKIKTKNKNKLLFTFLIIINSGLAHTQEGNTSQQVQNNPNSNDSTNSKISEQNKNPSTSPISKEQIIDNIKQNISNLKTNIANPQNNSQILQTTIDSLEANFQQLQSYLASDTLTQTNTSPSVLLPKENEKRKKKNTVNLPIAQPNAT